MTSTTTLVTDINKVAATISNLAKIKNIKQTENSPTYVDGKHITLAFHGLHLEFFKNIAVRITKCDKPIVKRRVVVTTGKYFDISVLTTTANGGVTKVFLIEGKD